jgi:hypothetical protein
VYVYACVSVWIVSVRVQTGRRHVNAGKRRVCSLFLSYEYNNVCMYAQAFMYVRNCIRRGVCNMHVCMCICIHVCMCIYMYICLHIYIYMYAYVCMRILRLHVGNVELPYTCMYVV